MRILPLLALVFLASPAVAQPRPKDTPAKQADSKLVGVWKLVATPVKLPDETEVTVEFTGDGVLVLKMNVAKSHSVSRGTYKADGQKLHYTIAGDGGDRKETLLIHTLTADTLVVIDPDKKREEFRRVAVVKK